MSESGEVQRPVNGATYFGEEAKALRESLGLSQPKFADRLHYQQAQVSKVENGTVLASEAFAAAMDRVAGTPGVYVRLRAKLGKQGHPEWFIPYVELEKSAAKVEDYSNAFVMGALQTAEYADAVYRAAHPRETDGQIKRRVELRLRRSEVLERDRPPLLWVIFHESVLRTEVGSPAVMVGQLEHLLRMASSPHVSLQVLQFTAGAPASGLPFTLLTQADGASVLYSETTGQGHVNDSLTAVRSWTATYERLRASAESEARSLRLIHSIMKEHADEQHTKPG
ncbi:MULTISPECIES: helix-turn-helix domain-containing protein [unclassified Streptomyces]|uniref:helix-turn-helix domain-containing protein n=1 Tax=unclassified Streptomyces TaxID=2593676 RepID=UPI0022B74324|nr:MULTISPECIES: helix-turn-helix transcriptional regulator [unclassified Streptomyces]MCZ7415072.1 helix-turn-helix transcriptional regulator [Streptomyces sp. WMMC897]MCZ7432015.1 helix-turn-helix transcriptional regulator [Streptomyces sp. WMMC1477]